MSMDREKYYNQMSLPDESENLLEVKDIKTYFYIGNNRIVKAVDGVSFSLKKGKVLGIIGESGSGKSVTSRTILRIVDRPGVIEGGEVITLHNPSHLPERFLEIREPYVKLNIYTPNEYMGMLLELIRNKRGAVLTVDSIGGDRVKIESEAPFSEIIMDFYDKLKSISRGYASMEYDFIGCRKSDLVRLDINIAGEPVDAFCSIVPRDQAHRRGNALTRKLKELIPRQMFEVPIQASANGRGVARVNIKALRKNVLAKCYGGDITRKRKLLEKQKKGKKRMKQVGSVVIPQEAFMAELKVE